MHPAFAFMVVAHIVSATPNTAVVRSTPKLPSVPSPSPTQPPGHASAALQKRAQWVSVCGSGQSTGCPVIGVGEVAPDPDGGGHYIPICSANGECDWIGYNEPKSDLGPSTSYELVTSANVPYIIPVVPLLPPEEPVPPPDDGFNGPEDEFTLSSITAPPSSCYTTTSPGTTTTFDVSFNADAYNEAFTKFGLLTLGYLAYYDRYIVNPTPTCAVQSAETYFDGTPHATPATWCACNSGHVYSTLSNTASPCAYTAFLTSDITISSIIETPHASPTTCKTVTTTFAPSIASAAGLTGPATYCTCDNNAQYALKTYTTNGAVTSSCIAPTPPPSAPTPVPAPYATGFCSAELELDSWSGDVNSIDPFWIQVKSMTDNKGNSLQGDYSWKRCGAANPCSVGSLLENPLVMLPIEKKPGDWSTHYIQFKLGAQNWLSTDPIDGHPPPGCKIGFAGFNQGLGDVGQNPIQEDMQCTFICNYSGGASSNGQIGQHPVHSSAIEAAATQSSGNGTSRANGTLEGINDGNCTVKRALKPGSWQYESDDVELMD